MRTKVAGIGAAIVAILSCSTPPAQVADATPAPQQAPAAPSSPDVVIHAGRLLADPANGRVLAQQSILVRAGRIVSVTAGYQTPDRRDASSTSRIAFVLPGLIDSHVHLTERAGPGRAHQRLPEDAAPTAPSTAPATRARRLKPASPPSPTSAAPPKPCSRCATASRAASMPGPAHHRRGRRRQRPWRPWRRQRHAARSRRRAAQSRRLLRRRRLPPRRARTRARRGGHHQDHRDRRRSLPDRGGSRPAIHRTRS